MNGNLPVSFCRSLSLALLLAATVFALKAPYSPLQKNSIYQRVDVICRSTPDSISATIETTTTKTDTSAMMEIVSKPYDSFIIDQWGVLHDGKIPYPGVVDCLKNLKSLGKSLILLSNSSKRKESSFKGLNKVGIDSSLFDDIVTSGEMAWNIIRERRFDFPIVDSDHGEKGENNNEDGENRKERNENNNKKLRVFVIGNNDDDVAYVTSCNCIPSLPEHADFILARGTFCILTGLESIPQINTDQSIENSTEHSAELSDTNAEHSHGKIAYKNAEHLLSAIDPWLARCTARNVPMLVSNPDFHRPGSGAPMPGQIGEKKMTSNNVFHHELETVKIRN
jgi:ribonucleotide monophosphatase NagD (HAD superfamily)